MTTNLVGKQLGQYYVVGLLGEGGMASVYRARQETIKRDVAIKIMKAEGVADNPDFLARFDREAQTMAALSHANIIKIFDYGEFGKSAYLVMELMTGGSLAELIRKTKGVPKETAFKIISQIGSALDYSHSEGVVHRDLKPANVLFDDAGNAMLTDFGLARLPNRSTELTHTGQVMGTPYYMPPEQWRDSMVDSRADIYSLGVILFEMIAGEPPFTAESMMALMYKHIQDAPPLYKLRRANAPELDPIISRALAKDPAKRYASAGAMIADMSRALGTQAPLGDAATQPPILDLVPVRTVPKPDKPSLRVDALDDGPRYRVRPPTPQKKKDVNPLLAWGVLGIGLLMLVGVMAAAIINATQKPPPPPTLTPLPVVVRSTVVPRATDLIDVATVVPPTLTPSPLPDKFVYSGLHLSSVGQFSYRLDVRYAGRQSNNLPFEGSMQISAMEQLQPFTGQLDIAMRETIPVFRDVLLRRGDFGAFPDVFIITGQSTYLVANNVFYRMGSAVPVTTRCESRPVDNINIQPIRAVTPEIFLPVRRLQNIPLTYNSSEVKYSGSISLREGNIPYTESLDIYLQSGSDLPSRVIYNRKWTNPAPAGLALTDISVEYRLNASGDGVNIGNLKAPSICTR